MNVVPVPSSIELERTMNHETSYNLRTGKARWFLNACLLLVAIASAQAQNLLPNPGFEETDSCKLGLGFRFPEQGPLHWFSSNGTPDYLQGCLNYGAANGLPMNAFTFQEPLDGESCVGMFSYYQNGNSQQREWVMVELLEPLVPGQTYYGSFYANAGFGGNAQYPQIWLASNNIGMLFTMQARQWDFPDPFPPYPNMAHVVRSEILADTVGWTLVSGSFVADSAYRFVMIGNFFTNPLTDTLHFAPPGDDPWLWFPRGYTLIDKACVSASPNGCDLASGLVSPPTEGLVLFPNPAVDELVLHNAITSEGVITDAIGRVVWAGRISGNTWRLQIADWPRGLYTLQMGSTEGIRSFKFMLVGH